MSEHRDKYSRLLAETLHHDWASGPAAGFARAAAAKARARRRLKVGVSVAGAAAVVALAVFVNGRKPSPLPLPEREAVVQRTPAAATAKPGYEIISDDELLAQLRDRPLLALKNSDGTRELVVLPNE